MGAGAAATGDFDHLYLASGKFVDGTPLFEVLVDALAEASQVAMKKRFAGLCSQRGAAGHRLHDRWLAAVETAADVVVEYFGRLARVGAVREVKRRQEGWVERFVDAARK